MESGELTVFIAVLILLSLVLIIITLFIVFIKRKNQLLVEKEKIESELVNAQIEIREATLRNISWELHDNIGQLMTLAKINAQLVDEEPEKIHEVTETISKALSELRSLSKSINPEYIKSLSLVEAIGLEIERFNRLDHIKSTLKIEGEPVLLDEKKEIIVFRILQEFFTNTIKHSRGSTLEVLLQYDEDKMLIEAKDNGVGFDVEQYKEGLGIQNMKNRARVIDARLEVSSKINEGTQLKLEYNY